MVPEPTLVVLQQVSEMVDGKIHFIAGVDQNVFHVEEGDRFFTAMFVVNPFTQETDNA